MSVSQKQHSKLGVFLTYTAYLLVRGSDSCHLYSEIQADGGASIWISQVTGTGDRVWRTTDELYSASAEKGHISLLLNFIGKSKS